MSGFANAAKSLISQTLPNKSDSDKREQLDHIKLLNAEGLSPRDTFRELKSLIDECGEDDKSVKLQAIKLLTQVHGMLVPEEVSRAAPVFQLVIQGDNARINTMLCPGAV